MSPFIPLLDLRCNTEFRGDLCLTVVHPAINVNDIAAGGAARGVQQRGK
jgi:hypothetical protein